jgi:hypothetical protein
MEECNDVEQISAIVMESQPLKRIYFDTNALYRWPNSANNLTLPFGVANWLKTEQTFEPSKAQPQHEGRRATRSNESDRS